MRPAQRRTRLPRTVRLLVAARAVNRLGAFSLPFLTVLLTTDFGAGTAAAGYVGAGFGVATIPSRLLGGRLADRIGRRRTIVLGLTGCTATQLALASAGNLASAALFAVLMGLAFEIYEPPSQALIADALPPAAQVRAYSLLNAALAAAGMGAGLLAAGLGRWDLRWLFVADALTCALCALTVHRVLPADHDVRRRPATEDPAAEPANCRTPPANQHVPRTDDAHATPGDRRTPPVNGPAESAVPSSAPATRPADSANRPATPIPTPRPWRDPALLVMLGAGTLFATVYLQIAIALPLTLDHRGLRPADAGLLFTTSAVTILAGQPLMARTRVAALPAPAAFGAGYVLLALGLAGYALAPGGLAGYAAATVVWSAGDLLLAGRAYAFVAGLAPAAGKARYLAAYGTSWGIGGIAAPLAGTQALERLGAGGLWWATSGTCLVLAAAHPAWIRREAGRRPPPDTAPTPRDAAVPLAEGT